VGGGEAGLAGADDDGVHNAVSYRHIEKIQYDVVGVML
jgi:hypothetical protein